MSYATVDVHDLTKPQLLLLMVDLLRAGEGIRRKRLLSLLGITTRTMQRYFQDLEALGYAIVEAGHPGNIRYHVPASSTPFRVRYAGRQAAPIESTALPSSARDWRQRPPPGTGQRVSHRSPKPAPVACLDAQATLDGMQSRQWEHTPPPYVCHTEALAVVAQEQLEAWPLQAWATRWRCSRAAAVQLLARVARFLDEHGDRTWGQTRRREFLDAYPKVEEALDGISAPRPAPQRFRVEGKARRIPGTTRRPCPPCPDTPRAPTA